MLTSPCPCQIKLATAFQVAGNFTAATSEVTRSLAFLWDNQTFQVDVVKPADWTRFDPGYQLKSFVLQANAHSVMLAFANLLTAQATA